MKAPRLGVVVLAALLAACASWRWSGSPAPDGRQVNTAVHGDAADESRHPAPPAEGAQASAAAIEVSTYAVRAPAIVIPAKGAIHCMPGMADAVAMTKMVRSGAPWARTDWIARSTALDFCPIAT